MLKEEGVGAAGPVEAVEFITNSKLCGVGLCYIRISWYSTGKAQRPQTSASVCGERGWWA